MEPDRPVARAAPGPASPAIAFGLPPSGSRTEPAHRRDGAALGAHGFNLSLSFHLMRAIVTGMIASYPLGGVVWDYGQYALGLEELGFEVFYLEDTGWNT